MADVYVYGFKPTGAATPADLTGDHVITGIRRCLNYSTPPAPHYWTVQSEQSSGGGLYSGIVVHNATTGQRISFISGTRVTNKRTVFCQLHPEIPTGATGISALNGTVVGGPSNGLQNPYASPRSPAPPAANSGQGVSILGNVLLSGNYYGLNGAGNSPNDFTVSTSAMTVAFHSYVVELEDALLIMLRRHFTVATNNLIYGGCLAGKILVPDNESDADLVEAGNGIDRSGIVAGIWSAASSNYYAMTYNDAFNANYDPPTSWLRVSRESWTSFTLSNSVIINTTTTPIDVLGLTTATSVSSFPLGPVGGPRRFNPYAVRARPAANLGAQVGHLKYVRQLPERVDESTIQSGGLKYDTGITPNSLSWIHFASAFGTSQSGALNTVFPWRFGGSVNVDP